MRPIGPAPSTMCWHCNQSIDRSATEHTARYIYRGDQPLTAIVEDWLHCACGAYQNTRRLNEILVETLGNKAS